jgi:predicted transcriptional regulator
LAPLFWRIQRRKEIKACLRAKRGRAWLYSPIRSREAYGAALMEVGLGESKDRPAALIHFVENMSEEEVAALREALRTMGGGWPRGGAALRTGSRAA